VATRIPSIDYLSRDFESIRQDLIDQIQFFNPEWTDRNASDFGITLIELFAYMGDILHFYIDRRAQNLYLTTCFTREAAVNILKLIDYEVPGKSSAVADEVFTLTSPLTGDFIIPENTQLSTTGETGTTPVTFETLADLGFAWEALTSDASATDTDIIVADSADFQVDQQINIRDDSTPDGESGTIAALPNSTTIRLSDEITGSYTVAANARISTVQATVGVQEGQTKQEDIGTSDGTDWQLFQLTQTPVAEGSVDIFVTVGVITTQWAEVENLAYADPTDKVYELSRDAADFVYARFGDGVTGAVPTTGATVSASYRVGGGTQGNVGANKITNVVSTLIFGGSPVAVTATNPLSASGGAEEMSLEDAKFFGPRSFRALGRAVTEDDYEILALEVAGVEEAKAVVRLPTVLREIDVYILPSGGYVPAQALIDQVQAYLDARDVAGMIVYVQGPRHVVDINLTAKVYFLSGYSESQVAPLVTAAISDFFSVDSDLAKFGKNVNLSDIMALIDNLEGVDHVDVSTLTLDPATTFDWVSAPPTGGATVDHIAPQNSLNLIDQELSVEFTAGGPSAKYKVVNASGSPLLLNADLDVEYTLSDGSLKIQIDAGISDMRIGDLGTFRTSQYVSNAEIEDYEVRRQGTVTLEYEEVS
jgi:hypothetical protein